MKMTLMNQLKKRISHNYSLSILVKLVKNCLEIFWMRHQIIHDFSPQTEDKSLYMLPVSFDEYQKGINDLKRGNSGFSR